MGLILYTKPNCPYCIVLKNMIDSLPMTYNLVDIEETPEAREHIRNKGHKSVPQLYWNEHHINKKDTMSITITDLLEMIDWAQKDEQVAHN